MAQADIVPSRVEAERCAASLPVGMFGIDDVLIAIEVISFGFKLWQLCNQPTEPAGACSAAASAQQDGACFNRARRRVRRSAKRQNLNLSTEHLNGLTAHMLLHVTKASPVSLAACCQEPLIQDDDSDD